MSTYTESTVTGHAWRRCNQIVIDNRRSATPTVRFDEETVVALDGATGKRPSALSRAMAAAETGLAPVVLTMPSKAGRREVEARYCLQVTGARVVAVVRGAMGGL